MKAIHRRLGPGGEKTLKGLVSQNQFQQLPDNALEHVEDVGRF